MKRKTPPSTNRFSRQFPHGVFLHNPSPEELFSGVEEAGFRHAVLAFYQVKPGFRDIKPIIESLKENLTIAYGHKGQYGKKSNTKGAWRFKDCTIEGGFFHPHLMLLFLQDRLRVILGSFNLVSSHFKSSGGTHEQCFAQDFPLRPDALLAAATVESRDSNTMIFREPLLRFLCTHLSGGFAWASSELKHETKEADDLFNVPEQLDRFDFSNAAGTMLYAEPTSLNPAHHPRTVLNSLTLPLAPAGQLLVNSGFLTSIRNLLGLTEEEQPPQKRARTRKKKTPRGFLESFQYNVNAPASTVKFVTGRTNLGKVYGLQGVVQDDLAKSFADKYWREANYKDDRRSDTHAKTIVALDQTSELAWLLVGGANFANPGWGEVWPLEDNNKRPAEKKPAQERGA